MTVKEFALDCGCIIGERLCAEGKRLLTEQEARYKEYRAFRSANPSVEANTEEETAMWAAYTDARESYVEHLRLPF